MTGKTAPLEATAIRRQSKGDRGLSGAAGDDAGKAAACLHFLETGDGGVDGNGGQNLPMILVEQASLVSAYPYATEDPVYTPPGEDSTPACSIDESLTSPTSNHKSTTTVFAPKEKPRSNKKKKGPWYVPSVTCIPIFIIVLLIGMVVMVPIILDKQKFSQGAGLSSRCMDPCIITLVESIPQNLTYAPGSASHTSVFSGWQNLLEMAESSIKIASSYWSLRSDDTPDMGTNTSWQGEEIFKSLLNAGKARGIKIQIAQSQPSRGQPDIDTTILAQRKAAEVRSVNLQRLLGAGILHTKMWLVDDQHFYLGSANLDWRSLTQVKELGVIAYNCSCLARDLAKIFDVYWTVGAVSPNGTLPKHWPVRDVTAVNSTSPMSVKFNETQPALAYFSSSPPQLSPEGREEDINAVLKVIRDAKKFVHIAVMDFVPAFLYSGQSQYWPRISDALKSAAIDRAVQVKLLTSNWTHTRREEIQFLKSFQLVDGIYGADIKVRLFTVPSFTEAQAKIPYARVNHNKYMVTDNCAYVGTSNWSADYFVNTGGIGLVVNETVEADDEILDDVDADDGNNFRSQLAEVFLRDWGSEWAKPLEGL